MEHLRYDPGAELALAASVDAAIELGHTFVGSEHLLLGLIRTEPSLFPEYAPPEHVRARVFAMVGQPQNLSAPGPSREFPYTSRAKRCLVLAADSAAQRGNRAVTTVDLLNGIRAEGKGAGARVLSYFGLGAQPSVSAGDAGDGAPQTFVTLSDESQHPFYDQIITQIKEAIAAGCLNAGDRLPSVRRLADSLGIAPGTVARAFKELEAEGVVHTDGARGTTVVGRDAPRISQGGDRIAQLVDLLRPVAVAAFHMGSAAGELFAALEIAIQGVFEKLPQQPPNSV